MNITAIKIIAIAIYTDPFFKGDKANATTNGINNREVLK